MFKVRNAKPNDFTEILRLNEESVHFLSPLTESKLIKLNDEAQFHKVVLSDNEVLAFCLAFREDADYDSVNFLWFKDHYDAFLYIDRVVVDIRKRKAGIAGILYDEIFNYARNTGVPIVSAEIDIAPPNPISLKFHEKYGFREVGKQEVADGKKVVSLQISSLQEL